MILNLDLDGVFVDFNGGFHKHFGWDYTPDAASWKLIDQVDNFYLSIDPIAGAKEFFDQILTLAPSHVRILTALPRLTGKLVTADQDKREWVSRYLSPSIEVICTDGWEGKLDYCHPGDILLDDSGRNVARWITSGGEGILHTHNVSSIFLLEYYLASKN